MNIFNFHRVYIYEHLNHSINVKRLNLSIKNILRSSTVSKEPEPDEKPSDETDIIKRRKIIKKVTKKGSNISNTYFLISHQA